MQINGIEVSKILEFAATPGFGKWKKYFPKESVTHPAKANLNLLEYLILSYTKEGDTLCDPMSGSGSTGVIATLNGRNCIQVELEEKFYKWMEQARENIEKTPQLTKKGKIINILGDSRNLSELLKEHEEEISHVLFSPPYGEAHQSKNLGLADGNRKDLRLYSWLKTNNPAQIDNLPFNANCIVTSPPYEGSLSNTKLDHDRQIERMKMSGISEERIKTFMGKANQLRDYMGAYSPRIDKTILRLRKHGRTDDKAGGTFGRSLGHPYSPKEENIGNLKKETYLSAMQKVYQECYRILKPQGKMIIIIKDFIRHFQVVKLHEYTRQLCESCGFKLEEVLLFRLPQQSFWRILYRKKHGHKVKDLDMLDYEWILIFEKEQKYLKEKG